MQSRRPKVTHPILHLCLGNRTLISDFHLRFFFSLLLVVRVRSCAVHSDEFLSDQGTTGGFQLLPSDTLPHRMFTRSPSSPVCSVVLSVQLITFEYRYGRQDHGTFGYKVLRLWISKIIRYPLGVGVHWGPL